MSSETSSSLSRALVCGSELRRLELEEWRKQRKSIGGGRAASRAALTASSLNNNKENDAVASEPPRRVSTSFETSKPSRPPPLRAESSAPLLPSSRGNTAPTAVLQQQLAEAQARLAEAKECSVALLAARDSARAELEQVLKELKAAVASEEEAHDTAMKLRAMAEQERQEHARVLASVRAEGATMVEALQSQVHEKDKVAGSLTEMLEKARAELVRAQQDCDAVRNELQGKSVTLEAALEAAVATHAAQTAALQAAEDVAAAERAAAADQAAALRAALDEAVVQRDAATAQQQHVDARLAEALEDVMRAHAAAEAHAAARASAESQASALAATLTELQNALADAESRVIASSCSATGDAVMVDAALSTAAAEHEAHVMQMQARMDELAHALALSQQQANELMRANQDLQFRLDAQAAEEERWRVQFEEAAAADLEDALADMRTHYEDLLAAATVQKQQLDEALDAAANVEGPAATPMRAPTPRRVSRLLEARATTPAITAMTPNARPVLCAQCRGAVPQERRQSRTATTHNLINDIPNAPPMAVRLRGVAAAVQAEWVAAGPVAWLFSLSTIASLGQQQPAVLRVALLLFAAGALASASRRM